LKRIEITISPTGESKIETSGFVGDECRNATKSIEAALGKTSSEELKAEFHEQSTNENSLKNTN
jgi:hypothetical protein